MKPKLTPLQKAKAKMAHALAGKPLIEKLPPARPPKGQAINRETREAIKLSRVAGTSRQELSKRHKVPVNTIRQWEIRGKWPIPEAIQARVIELRNIAAGIKPAKPKSKPKALSSRIDKLNSSSEVSHNLALIDSKALGLLEVGEMNAELVARKVSGLIKKSLDNDVIPAPRDLSELSTAFKMVEQATGRNKPAQVAIALGVSVSPHMSGIVGEIRPQTSTLNDGQAPQEAAPSWLSSQLTDDSDDGS